MLCYKQEVSTTTINERVRTLRKELGLTQSEFGKRIRLSQNHLTGIETGKRNLTDTVSKLICNEFNVNEQWLRTGEGKTFTEQDESLIRQLSEKYHLSATGENIVRLFCSLDEHSRNIIEKFIVDVAEAANPAERVLYIARSGDQGEVHIAKDAQEEALRALDESSDPDL